MFWVFSPHVVHLMWQRLWLMTVALTSVTLCWRFVIFYSSHLCFCCCGVNGNVFLTVALIFPRHVWNKQNVTGLLFNWHNWVKSAFKWSLAVASLSQTIHVLQLNKSRTFEVLPVWIACVYLFSFRAKFVQESKQKASCTMARVKAFGSTLCPPEVSLFRPACGFVSSLLPTS